jgi:hypothetical protein
MRWSLRDLNDAPDGYEELIVELIEEERQAHERSQRRRL